MYIVNSPEGCKNARAIAYVFYAGKSLDNPQARQSPTKQRANLRFNVNLELCNPNTHQPIYPFIEGVENLLIDFDPQVGKTGRLYKVSDDYYAFEDGTKWVYNSVYALEALVVNRISF